ncbi:NAD(P)/FAD-dependent oxidoreductase [Halomonas organivorans]|uniref:Glycine/D-amino acid oxidase-like deaminating enzyme n=1 Tax=Halomonas organivorans TaxID=257772 RepID=A0A7W5BYT0_9GAMM|nr:FAD-dependent oxidoreductase [Halomonas organivorans]MBB3141294.1 glycine/D-amino acid oxidase-like deaminating enzyme [Halomonas organivorans]
MTTSCQPSHQRPCGWNAWLSPSVTRPALKTDEQADVVIVGAGYTGLAAARAWASERSEDRILVLDADAIGEGSPGRNSGFMLEIALANDASADEISRLSRLNALSRATMADLKRLVDHHGIDCQLHHSGTYRAARGSAGKRSLAAYRQFLLAAGLRHEVLDRGDLEARIGTDYYHQGLYSPDCYLVQPAALIRGLADALAPNVILHEHSPATGVVRDGNRWRVTTPHGTVRAPHVILANNAFSRALGADRSRLTAIYTYAAVTEVLSDSLRSSIAGHVWGLLPAHRLGCTLRTTADGRLMIRSCYSYEREADNSVITASLRQSLDARYPLLADVPFTSLWGGTTGLTHNGAPVWGEIQPGLHVSAGCNGGGIVKGTCLGDALARQAMGKATLDVPALFGRASWMPPEPWRHLGFALTSAWERRKGIAET